MNESVDLKIMLLNAENLFLLFDKPVAPSDLVHDKWHSLSSSIYTNKPLGKTLALAEIIKKINPDIVLLCEVGGSESLTNFNNLFLGNAYSPALIEGNSNRNIDVGYLIKKNLPFYFDLISNRNKLINFLYRHEKNQELSFKSHKFSRDVAELHLFKKNVDSPFMILLLTHLKSRLDPENIDPYGFERRQAELNALIEIYNELENRHKGQVPILVAGDFNGNASPVNTDMEFDSLYKSTKLRDVCDLAQVNTEKRFTFYQVSRNSLDGKQLDYAFTSPSLAPHVDKSSVQIFRYTDKMGCELAPPSSLDAKQELPSDHYPIIFNLTQLPIK